MGIFYKPSSYRKMLKFLKKNGFSIDEGAKHTKATHEKTGIKIIFPRNTNISNGLTEDICKKLIELGLDEKKVKKALL